MPRVVVCDEFDAEGLALLRNAHLQVDHRPGLKGTELKTALHSADAVIIRTATRITADLLSPIGSLRLIVRAGVGLDHVDVAAAHRLGVMVMNTPGSNTISACEQTWALIFALMRHTPEADMAMKQGRWERHSFLGSQLAGKTLGILGLGRIGKAVARRALAMEMNVVAYDPLLTAERTRQLGVEPVFDLNALLRKSDILTIHVPLTDDSRNLIGAPQLAMMKRGSRLINCARGGIVDEQALCDMLQSAHLAGAALDVFAEEPLPIDHPLRKQPNVILTPHLGAATGEAHRAMTLDAAQAVVAFLAKGPLLWPENLTAADRQPFDELKPWLAAAHRLGLQLGRLQQSTIRHATLSIPAQWGGKAVRWLTEAFTTGLLETGLSEMITPADAMRLAHERGIDIIARQMPGHGDRATLLQACLETENGSHEAEADMTMAPSGDLPYWLA